MPFGIITLATERLHCKRRRSTAMQQGLFGAGSLAASDLKQSSLSRKSQADRASSAEHAPVCRVGRTMFSKGNERRPR